MAYLGRYQLGQFVPLTVQCLDASGTPTLPTGPPTIDVWLGSTLIVAAKEIPILDRYGVTAMFRYRLPLDGRFSAGSYMVSYTYTVGSLVVFDIDAFQITAGGDINGAVISMTEFVRPHAKFIVYQTDQRLLLYGKNPRL